MRDVTKAEIEAFVQRIQRHMMAGEDEVVGRAIQARAVRFPNAMAYVAEATELNPTAVMGASMLLKILEEANPPVELPSPIK